MIKYLKFASRDEADAFITRAAQAAGYIDKNGKQTALGKETGTIRYTDSLVYMGSHYCAVEDDFKGLSASEKQSLLDSYK